MKDIKIKLKKARDTKGTFVFQSDDDGAAVRSLYVSKTAIDGDAPDEIEVTIKGK